jgi:hypothetical protein
MSLISNSYINTDGLLVIEDFEGTVNKLVPIMRKHYGVRLRKKRQKYKYAKLFIQQALRCYLNGTIEEYFNAHMLHL